MKTINIVSTKAITLNVFFDQIINTIIKRNHKLSLWTSDPENLNYTNLELNRIFLPSNIIFLINPFNFIFCLYKLRKKIKFCKNDIFLINTPLASHFFRIASIGLNVKTIYFVHGFRFHKLTYFFYYWFFYTLEYLLSFLTFKYIVINNEDELIVMNSFKKEYLKLNGVGINLHKNKKINNTLVALKNNIKVIVIGVYKKSKGYEDLIWLASKLKKENLTFDCYGYGNYNEFNKKIQKLKLKNICLNKFDKNLIDKLNDYNLMVHLSKREGLPVSIMECLSLGMPVIGYDIRGLNDLITNNYNGFLCPFNKKEKVLGKLFQLTKDKTKLLILSNNSFKTLDFSYSKEYVANKLVDFIELN